MESSKTLRDNLKELLAAKNDTEEEQAMSKIEDEVAHHMMTEVAARSKEALSTILGEAFTSSAGYLVSALGELRLGDTEEE